MEKSHVYNILNRITDSIIEHTNKDTLGYGLLSGTGGISLYFYTLYTATHNKRYLSLSYQYLNKSIELFESGPLLPTYCGGVAGLALLSSLFEKVNATINFVEPNVDAYLFWSLQHYLKDDNLDYLHGATGIASYFAEKAYVSPSYQLAFRATNMFLDYLFDSCYTTDGQTKWLFYNRHRQKESNISMSHGMSAIVCYLARLIKNEFTTNHNIYGLCKTAISYINSQAFDVNDNGSFYPYKSKDDPNAMYRSRLAWCYGDLGIALSQFYAGTLLQDVTIINRSLEVLIYAATNRRNLSENGVVDAGICHGTSGIAQCFNRMYQNTHATVFKDALDYWVEKTISFSSEDEYAGYIVHNPIGKDYHSLSLLEGLTGIGLSLISYLFSNSYQWDKILNIII